MTITMPAIFRSMFDSPPTDHRRHPSRSWAISRRSLLFMVTWLLVGLLFGGCHTAEPPARKPVSRHSIDTFVNDKPERLRPLYKLRLEEGRRNEVLNSMQIGVAAMEAGENGLAEEAFDRALLRIEAIYAGSEEAAKARSLWFSEGAKDFKGDAYERSMAYYYRGLLYLWKGDFENARASFKGGILQDAFAEEKQYACDFALLIFLSGWASHQLGDRDKAGVAYAEVKKLRKDFKPPPWKSNLLLIAESGYGPRKVAAGEGFHEMRYRRGKGFRENRVLFRNRDGQEMPAYPMEDIYWQATTRGGRAVDRILEGKAIFQKRTRQIGTTLTSAGAFTALLAGHNQMDGATLGVAAGLGALGAVSTIASINTRPHADVRYWKNLPDTVHVLTARADPDQPHDDLEAIFHQASGNRKARDASDARARMIREGIASLLEHKGLGGPKHKAPELDETLKEHIRKAESKGRKSETRQSGRLHFAGGSGLGWYRSRPAYRDKGMWHNLLRNE